MQVRLKGTEYVSRAGDVCLPGRVVDLPTDEAYELIRCGLADVEDGPQIEHAVLSGPVETREKKTAGRGRSAKQ